MLSRTPEKHSLIKSIFTNFFLLVKHQLTNQMTFLCILELVYGLMELQFQVWITCHNFWLLSFYIFNKLSTLLYNILAVKIEVSLKINMLEEINATQQVVDN